MNFRFTYFGRANDTKPKAAKFESFELFAKNIEENCAKLPIKTPVDAEVLKDPANAKKILDKVKRDQPAISLAVYKEDAETRHAIGITRVTGICGDLDGISEAQAVKVFSHLEELNVQYCAFTTWSHGWAKPGISVKVVIPFEDELPIDGDEDLWRAIWSRLNEMLFFGLSDAATCDASRLIFLPSVPLCVGNKDVGYFENQSPSYSSSGEFAMPLSAMDLFIEAYDSLQAKRNEIATVTRKVEVTSSRARQYLKGIIDNLRNASDGGKHLALTKGSFAAGGLIGALSESEVESELLAVVNEWHSQGRIDSMRIALGTIKSGITKGRAKPIEFEETTHEEIEFVDDISALQMRVIEVEEVTIPKVQLQKLTAEQVWQSCKKLGGFIELFCNEAESRCDFYQPAYLLSALVAYGQTLASRRQCFDGLTSSQLIAVIGGTGTGKNAPQKFVQKLLEQTAPGWIGPSDFVSWVSTLERIKQAADGDHGLFFCIDEYGATLKTLFSKNNTQGSQIRTQMLKITTTNTSKERFARSLGRGGEDMVIDAPSIVLLGNTTDEALRDAIDNSLGARDGFFGRHLWFCGESMLPQRNHEPNRGPLSKEITEGCKFHTAEFRAYQEQLAKIEVEITNPKNRSERETAIINQYSANNIKCTPTARRALTDFVDLVDQRRREEENGAVEGVLARLGEQAKRVALGLSTILGGNKALIDLDIALCAIDIVALSSQFASSRFESVDLFSSGTNFEKNVAKFRRYVKTLEEKDIPVNRRNVMKYAHLRTSDLKEIGDWYLTTGQTKYLHVFK